jgi:hypothetical protein
MESLMDHLKIHRQMDPLRCFALLQKWKQFDIWFPENGSAFRNGVHNGFLVTAMVDFDFYILACCCPCISLLFPSVRCFETIYLAHVLLYVHGPLLYLS